MSVLSGSGSRPGGGGSGAASSALVSAELYRAGFRDITVHVHPTTTVGLPTPERHALFVESFSYRRNYLVRLLEKTPDRADLRQELATMDATLQELELDFEDDSFFYLEFDVAAIARVAGASSDS